MKRARVPGLLLGVLDGGASLLERRVLRLLERRVLFARRGRVVCAGVCVVVMGAASFGVGMLAVRASVTQVQRVIRFDAVTIKPGDPRQTISRVGTTPDGFEMVNAPMKLAMMQAYFSIFDRTSYPLRNAPAWMDERFDIVAKVAPEDAGEWEKMRASGMEHAGVLQQALQAMFAERMKLAVHRVSVEGDGYALVVSRRGPRLQQTNDEPSNGTVIKLADGAKASFIEERTPQEWTFYHTSMHALTTFLQENMRKPIVDQTGLNGKYHFVLDAQDFSNMEEDARNPDGSNGWRLNELGLDLKPIKVKGEAVVIDHIERPTEN